MSPSREAMAQFVVAFAFFIVLFLLVMFIVTPPPRQDGDEERQASVDSDETNLQVSNDCIFRRIVISKSKFN